MLRTTLLICGVGVALVAALPGLAGKPSGGTDLRAHYPDIRTVVPTHLQLVNSHQRDILRFANGIANTGPGPWALAPDRPLETATDVVGAIQEIRDRNAPYSCEIEPPPHCYNVLEQIPAGIFEFHPAHNHWHIGDVALFELRKGSSTGPVVGGNSIKTTFCLLDSYQLDLKSPNTTERSFWDCYRSFQGISTGWVDQYHQALDGQQLDLTGVPNADDYYLVSTANHARLYTELDYTNNTAWVRFKLYADSKGNRKVVVTGHSPCDSPGLCGERSTNR
jgi:Lysyl oxidase